MTKLEDKISELEIIIESIESQGNKTDKKFVEFGKIFIEAVKKRDYWNSWHPIMTQNGLIGLGYVPPMFETEKMKAYLDAIQQVIDNFPKGYQIKRGARLK